MAPGQADLKARGLKKINSRNRVLSENSAEPVSPSEAGLKARLSDPRLRSSSDSSGVGASVARIPTDLRSLLLTLRDGGSASGAAKPLPDFDPAERRCRGAFDELVPESLVRPLLVVVRHELVHSPAKRSLANEDHAVEALGLDAQNEPPSERVHVRSPVAGRHHGDACGLQRGLEGSSELRVPIQV